MKKYLAIFLVFIAFTAKAQTPGENFNVTHYEIHLNNLDFSAHTIAAVTTVTLTASGAINTIELELKSLTVSNVTATGANVSNFSQNGDILTINLASALAANASASFTITYSGSTFNDGWGGILWSGNYVCNMGVGFESIPHNLGKTWFPCVDNFTDKASYDVYVTVPTDKVAVCGGNLVNTVNNGDGTKTVHYNVPQEIATYHISFVAGDYVEWTDTYSGMNGTIPINVYVKPSQLNKVEGTFVNVKDIANYFETCYGPYPFNRIGYSITSVGCMEHIDNIGITSGVLTGNTSQESYIAHELSHMWFGNKITCARAEEMWLNEGFAQFCGMNYQEAIYGEDTYWNDMNSQIETMLRTYDKAEGWPTLNNIPQNNTYGNVVYKKGATIVHTLRNYLGKELFNETMRYYLNKFAYQSVTSEDLRDAITEYTGIDMTDFFDTWVFTCGEPHYAIDRFTVTPNGSNYDVDIYTSYKHRHSDYISNGTVTELAFMDRNWNIFTDTIHWNGGNGHTTKTLDFEPIAVFCDYYNKFADARIDKYKVFNSNGSLSSSYLVSHVHSITDSTYLRIEYHLVGANHPYNPSWQYKFSEEKYWTVFRDDKGIASIDGVFTYSTQDDPSIIQTANDSVVLLYRENSEQPWHSIPYTIFGYWEVGEITVENLVSGEYTLASVDKAHLGLGENNLNTKKMILAPNPTDNFVRISTQSDNCTILIINSLGQILDSYVLSGNELTISLEDYPVGIYFINLVDEKKNIISTEKLVKR